MLLNWPRSSLPECPQRGSGIWQFYDKPSRHDAAIHPKTGSPILLGNFKRQKFQFRVNQNASQFGKSSTSETATLYFQI